MRKGSPIGGGGLIGSIHRIVRLPAQIPCRCPPFIRISLPCANSRVASLPSIPSFVFSWQWVENRDLQPHPPIAPHRLFEIPLRLPIPGSECPAPQPSRQDVPGALKERTPRYVEFGFNLRDRIGGMSGWLQPCALPRWATV